MFEMTQNDVDGIIMRETQNYQSILDKNIPVVFVEHLLRVADASRIHTDNAAIGKMAAEYYLDRGFKYFAFIGYDRFFWSQSRLESFRERLKESDLEVQVFKQPEIESSGKNDKEQKLLVEWLKTIKKPAGLFACNDDRAQQVISTCNLEGLHVPDEIAVLGVDDDEFSCNLSNPPISSIALNVEQAGYKAAELLENLMSGKVSKPQELIVDPVRVVTRQSTDIFSIKDPIVLAAVKFIKNNSYRLIQVNDVLDEVAVSRRCLYDKFNKFLGTSIYSYIKRCRVVEIERMLIDTDMSINDIALKLGFSTADHIAEYFRSETGMNPRAYRAKYE
jgi:LacI family transcriptional regulator